MFARQQAAALRDIKGELDGSRVALVAIGSGSPEGAAHFAKKLRFTGEMYVNQDLGAYKAFRLEPRGRHEISLCLGTACHVRGAKRVQDAIERELEISAGGTTADRRFSFETVRCLGCCGQAPVMTVDGDLVSRLDHLTVGKALEKYK